MVIISVFFVINLSGTARNLFFGSEWLLIGGDYMYQGIFLSMPWLVYLYIWVDVLTFMWMGGGVDSVLVDLMGCVGHYWGLVLIVGGV